MVAPTPVCWQPLKGTVATALARQLEFWKNCTLPVHVPFWLHEHAPQVRLSVTWVPTVEAAGQLVGQVAFVGMIMHALNDGRGVIGRQARPVPHPPPPFGSWLLQIRPAVVVTVGSVALGVQVAEPVSVDFIVI